MTDTNTERLLNLSRAFALLFVLGLSVVFALTGVIAPDYRTYIAAVTDRTSPDFTVFLYGYWLIPLFQVLSLLPLPVGYLLFSVANVVGVWWATRVFRGNLFIALFSYQMLSVLWYGNIVGIVAGALALMQWSMRRKRWLLAGTAWALAAGKMQSGLPLGLAVWLLEGRHPRPLLILLLVVVASLALYPGWPQDIINTAGNANTSGNMSLWQWVGPLALLLWLRLPRTLTGITATLALTSPYFQQGDLIMLLVLPVGALGLLGNTGFLFTVYGWEALKLTVVFPAAVYIRGLFDRRSKHKRGNDALAASTP